MQVLDMILDVLAYIWYGIKRIFKNPVLRDAAIILLSVLVSVLVINARTKSINEQAEKRIAAIEQRYQSELAAAQSQTAGSATQSTQQTTYSADAEYIAKVVAGRPMPVRTWLRWKRQQRISALRRAKKRLSGRTEVYLISAALTLAGAESVNC